MTLLRRAGWTLVVVALLIASPRAQSDIAQLLAGADAFLLASNLKQARPLYERALTAARETVREPEIARALLGLADVAIREGFAANGRAAATEALALVERLDDRERIADANYLLALIERAARNPAGAFAHAQRSLELYEALGHQRGIALAAYRAGSLADGDEASRLFERSAAAARALGDASLEAQALHNHGDQLFNDGRYEQSIEKLTQAATAFESVKEFNDVGTVYNSIGRVYRAHGRLDEALKYQQAALALHRKGNDRFMLLQSLNAVGVVYQRLDDLASARTYLEEALAVANSLPAKPAAIQAQDFLRANMAGVLIDLGEFAPAAAALEQVIATGRDAFPSVRYGYLSTAYVGLGRAADALAAAEKAVALCGESRLQCAEAHNTRADAQAAVGNREAALRDLSLAIDRIEGERAQLVPADFFKKDFSTYYKSYYSSAIARQLDAGLERDALETAELARSRAFLDLLASRSIAPAAGAAVPLTLRGGAAPGAASPVMMAPANAAELIRTAARLRSTLLMYWVGAGETVIFVVKPDGAVHARRVNVSRTKLSALVHETTPFGDTGKAARAPASPPVLRQSSSAWRALYTLLVAPVRAQLPAARGALLTIVPHDTLSSLSFAALQDNRGRYLLEDYTLHYAPAGALFQFTAAQRRPQPRSGEMLIVADPETARRSTLDPPLPRLPGARTEAAAITRQLNAMRVVSLTGAAATESAVRERAPARSILHLAAHAIVREDDPFASYIALGRSPGNENADGVLTAQDVYGLKLPADLVVLSACRSASGAVAGDGIATFARAFLYAGAASLVASVWEVADEPSNRLLPDFYRAWLGGATKSAALRQAQLRLLADLRAGRVRVTTPIGPVAVPEHPVFWAGFILFGEPD